MFKKIIAQQFKRPRGILGHFSARFMKKNNQEYYARVVEMLDIQDEDTILEIGCGAGATINQIVCHNKLCRITGIDFSAFMIKKALKNNRENIRNGRVRLQHSDICTYYAQERFSKIFAINVVYFWDEVDTVFHKIAGLLKENGRFIIFMSSPERMNNVPFAVDGVFNKYEIDYVKEHLTRCGFARVEHQTVIKNGWDTYYIAAFK